MTDINGKPVIQIGDLIFKVVTDHKGKRDCCVDFVKVRVDYGRKQKD